MRSWNPDSEKKKDRKMETAEKLVIVEKADREELDMLVASIDLSDTSSIIQYGAGAQQNLGEVSQQLLEGVKTKELGETGSALDDMVLTIQGFDLDALDSSKNRWFKKLFSGARSIKKFIAKYETIDSQVTKITDRLEDHKTTLMKDILSLDRLYDASLACFRELEKHIDAGQLKVDQLESAIIPDLSRKADDTGDVLVVEQLSEVRICMQGMERRIHDLRLTRQVTMQSLPSIRMIQENNKELLAKINSALSNTVPLWKTQLAQAVSIYRMGRAARDVKNVQDLTNELLESNAETLKQGNAIVHEQMERGVFDIESIRKANDTLVASIQESIDIVDRGRKARKDALGQLSEIEENLTSAMTSVITQKTSAA